MSVSVFSFGFLNFAAWMRDLADATDLYGTSLSQSDKIQVALEFLGSSVKDSLLNFVFLPSKLVALPAFMSNMYDVTIHGGNIFQTQNSLDVVPSGASFDLGLGFKSWGPNFWVALNNSVVLSLPFSAPQLYAVVCLLVWGVPCGFYALSGWVWGQALSMVVVLFGWDGVLTLWQNCEVFALIAGMAFSFRLACRGVQYTLYQPTIKWKETKRLRMVLVETACASAFNHGGYMHSLGFTTAGGLNHLQSGLTQHAWSHDLNLVLYLLGLSLGCFIFSTVLGALLWLGTRKFYTAGLGSVGRFKLGLPRHFLNLEAINQKVSFVLSSLIGLSVSLSLPWFSMDYFVLSPLGLVADDRALPDLVKRPSQFYWSRVHFSNPEYESWIMPHLVEDQDDFWSLGYMNYEFGFDTAFDEPGYVDHHFQNDVQLFPSDFGWNHRWMLHHRTEEKVDSGKFGVAGKAETSTDKTGEFFNLDKENRGQTDVRLKDKVGLHTRGLKLMDVEKMYIDEYPSIRMNRENLITSTRGKGFVDEIARALFRRDVYLGQNDRYGSDDYLQTLAVKSVKRFRDAHDRTFGMGVINFFKPFAHKFNLTPVDYALSYNTSRNYDVHQRRDMMLNYLNFICLWNKNGDLWTNNGAQYNSAPVGMGNRAYHHQFQGTMTTLRSHTRADVVFRKDLDLVRHGRIFDRRVKGKKPRRQKANLPLETWQNQNITKPHVGRHVYSFDLPLYNVRPNTAQISLHDELYGQKPHEENHGTWFKNASNTNDAYARWRRAKRNMTARLPKNNVTEQAYLTQVRSLQRWFFQLTDVKRRHEQLLPFTHYDLSYAPMYVAWDEGAKKMLVRQGQIPNLIDYQGSRLTDLTTPNPSESPAHDQNETKFFGDEGRKTKPKPVWYRFKAWVNGVNQPSRSGFYRTPEFKASAMDIQRIARLTDIHGPPALSRRYSNTKLQTKQLAKNLSEENSATVDYERFTREYAGGKRPPRTALEDMVAQMEHDKQMESGKIKTHTVLRSARLASNQSAQGMGFYKTWHGSWDVLNRLPPMYTVGLAAETWEFFYDEFIVDEQMEDYAMTGYDMPPRIDGLAWPGTLNVLRFPRQLREIEDYDASLVPNHDDIEFYPVVDYGVLNAPSSDTRGVLSRVDLGIVHRDYYDDQAYFNQASNSTKAWLQSQAEFERLYDRYYAKPKASTKPSAELGGIN